MAITKITPRTHNIKPMHMWPNRIPLRFNGFTPEGQKEITKRTGLRPEMFQRLGIFDVFIDNTKLLMSNPLSDGLVSMPLRQGEKFTGDNLLSAMVARIAKADAVLEKA